MKVDQMTSIKLLLVRSNQVPTEETEATEPKERDLNDLSEGDFIDFVNRIQPN